MLPPAAGLSRLPRSLLVVHLIGVLLVATAAPAAAHTRAQAASNYRSEITSAPALDGVEWRTYAGGDLIAVVNRSAHELVVSGYEGEPYLRVGPDGVFENANSPATYLNTERYADVAVPPRADATAPPQWVRVADGPSRAWHDHRVHWMSPSPPRAVADADGDDVDIHEWTLELTYDGAPHALTGQLRWVEPGAWWPWLAAALLLTAPIGARLRGRSRGLPLRPAAAGVAAIALLNSIHFADELLAWPAPTLDVLFGVFHTALFVGVGLAGAAIAWRGRQGPQLSLGIASGAVLLHQGLLQLPILTTSQLPTIWPEGLLRLAVATSIAQALWVTAVLVAAHQRAPRPDAAEAGTAPTPDARIPDPDRRPHKELI